jgi:hypothetical protein
LALHREPVSHPVLMAADHLAYVETLGEQVASGVSRAVTARAPT